MALGAERAVIALGEDAAKAALEPGETIDDSGLYGKAKDAASPITELAYSVDGGDWAPIAPKDGVFDELEEAFTVKLPSLATGGHTIGVRAVDSAGSLEVTLQFRPVVLMVQILRRRIGHQQRSRQVLQVLDRRVQSLCELQLGDVDRHGAAATPTQQR